MQCDRSREGKRDSSRDIYYRLPQCSTGCWYRLDCSAYVPHLHVDCSVCALLPNRLLDRWHMELKLPPVFCQPGQPASHACCHAGDAVDAVVPCSFIFVLHRTPLPWRNAFKQYPPSLTRSFVQHRKMSTRDPPHVNAPRRAHLPLRSLGLSTLACSFGACQPSILAGSLNIGPSPTPQ